jgi:hypothetical protein
MRGQLRDHAAASLIPGHNLPVPTTTGGSLSHLHPVGPNHSQTYQILMLSLFALIVLIPLYAFTEMELCGSLIFSVVLQVIGYLLAGILVTKECYRLTHWPGWAIKLFLCLCLVTLIVSAVTYSSHLSAPAAIVVVCGQFVILCIANMTAWLKDYMLGPDEVSKLELDRVCVLDYEYDDKDVKRRSRNQSSSWSFSGLCTTLHCLEA